MKNKEAVGNLGEEEMSFMKRVRMTRDDTRRDANDLFSIAHQSRERDVDLMGKLFEQAPAALTMSNQLLKEGSAEQWDEYEKIKVAYNVHHYFESGAHLTPAQRRFPELQKVALVAPRPTVSLKKIPALGSATGATAGESMLTGART